MSEVVLPAMALLCMVGAMYLTFAPPGKFEEELVAAGAPSNKALAFLLAALAFLLAALAVFLLLTRNAL